MLYVYCVLRYYCVRPGEEFGFRIYIKRRFPSTPIGYIWYIWININLTPIMHGNPRSYISTEILVPFAGVVYTHVLYLTGNFAHDNAKVSPQLYNKWSTTIQRIIFNFQIIPVKCVRRMTGIIDWLLARIARVKLSSYIGAHNDCGDICFYDAASRV